MSHVIPVLKHPVGVVGLGLLGRGIATCLLAQGAQLTLLNRGTLGGTTILRPQTVEALTARHRVALFDHTFQNLLDWAVEDTDLLQIRSAGAFARTLRPLEASIRRTWEIAQYAIALSAVGILAFLPYYRRRKTQPFTTEASR